MRALLAATLALAALGLGRAAASPREEAAARLAESERQRSAGTQAQAAAERDLAAAEAQASRLADERVAQASALRLIEAQVLSAEAALTASGAAEAKAEAALAADADDFATLLPVMLRLSRAPLATALAVPAAPERALEGLLVTRALAMQLSREAAALRAGQDRAAGLRAATAARAATLATARAAQAARAAALDDAMRQAGSQVSQAEAAGRRAAQDIADAAARGEDVRSAIAAMDAAEAHQAAEAARRTARDARRRGPAAPVAVAVVPPGAARLVTPVAGPVLHAFGSAADDGPATGITFAVAPGAYVASPCGGRVAFAAPFRSYGQLIIVECGGGTDVVLAGLGSLAANPGHTVRPGEPVGRMAAGRGNERGGLYLEVRDHGQPVNPVPLLSGHPS